VSGEHLKALACAGLDGDVKVQENASTKVVELEVRPLLTPLMMRIPPPPPSPAEQPVKVVEVEATEMVE
jgi:hypothetical protein